MTLNLLFCTISTTLNVVPRNYLDVLQNIASLLFFLLMHENN